jgi:hypothetical protein
VPRWLASYSIYRRHGVTYVCDTQVAADLAKAGHQPEREAAFVRGIAGRIGSTPHDRYSEGDVPAGSHGAFPNVERGPCCTATGNGDLRGLGTCMPA